MKLKKFSFTILMATSLCTMSLSGIVASAVDVKQPANVDVKDSGITPPIDPEIPDVVVDPDKPNPKPKGSLRIDFVSSLDFGSVKIGSTNRKYDSRAQLFLSDTEARGNYIQITDVREESTGWTLQMEQTKQFVDSKGNELTGAVLSYDNAWANATHITPEITPDVTRETLSLVPGEAEVVAKAKENAGWGVWTIEFGASTTNNNGQKGTLYPLTDSSGAALIDSRYKKQAYGNSAITLSVPNSTKILPTEYKTEIIWTIANFP